jgi:CRP/FNR family transcriptional regulator, nitrogen oxide reductase regulator
MSKVPPLSRQVLSNLELFRGLPAAALDDVLASAGTRSFARDFRVFNQGETRVRAHVLIDGWIRISQSGSDGAQIVVRFIGPGDIFGAISLFTDRRYPADADTLTDATEVSWSDKALLDLMNNHPQIAINAVRIVGNRLQEAQHRVRELATQRAERRVAHALLRLLHQVGTTTSRGIVIRFPLRRKDIADIAGTTLYSASRILSAWERAGWLKTLDRRIAVESLSDLMRIAEDESGQDITPLPP